MDRLIAPNTVSAADADAAPATGTPGYATDGNPATGQLASFWPAYQYNAFQEELIAVIVAGGQSPDRSNNGQVLAAIMALIAGKITTGATTDRPANPSNGHMHIDTTYGFPTWFINSKWVAASGAPLT